MAKSKKPKTGHSLETQADDNEKFVFFYGKDFVFSQFHPAKFTVDGVTYTCMEQYMHHQKALTFKDAVRAKQIMETTNPVEHKKLGRQVINFDKDVWNEESVKVVRKGSLEKYRQNPELKAQLLATHPRTLVEASPRDRLWGIGMGSKHPDARNPSKWRGRNLLGYILTDVRDTLIAEDKGSC